MRVDAAGFFADRVSSLLLDSREVRGLGCRDSSRPCRAAISGPDARAIVRAVAGLESDGWTRVERDEIPGRSLCEAEDSRVEYRALGGRASRETPADLDELVAEAVLAVRGLTSG